VPGYIAGKASYREDQDGGFALFLFITGLFGYIGGWILCPDEMLEVHGIRVNPDGPPVLARFFGEVEK
jgi:hypothetical protein